MFVYGDVEKANHFFPRTGFLPRFVVHGCTRLAVKLDFICGLLLYEINYGGSTEEIRRYCLFGAQASGNADRFKAFAEDCMAEYGLDGWRVPDLSDPGELSYHVLRKGA